MLAMPGRLYADHGVQAPELRHWLSWPRYFCPAAFRAAGCHGSTKVGGVRCPSDSGGDFARGKCKRDSARYTLGN